MSETCREYENMRINHNCCIKLVRLVILISIIFVDQMPTYLVFKKVHSVLTEQFSTVPPLPNVTVRKNNKAPFKAALSKYPHTPAFTVYMDFACVKMIYNIFVRYL